MKSSAIFIAITPSAAILSAFLAALLNPFLRKYSIASSIFPLHSFNAFLHSMIPASVFLRNSATTFAEISCTSCFICFPASLIASFAFCNASLVSSRIFILLLLLETLFPFLLVILPLPHLFQHL